MFTFSKQYKFCLALLLSILFQISSFGQKVNLVETEGIKTELQKNNIRESEMIFYSRKTF